MKIIDVNAGWGFWPIQRFSHSTLEEWERVFEKAGIDEVWVSAVEAILSPEPDSWDARLFERLEDFPRFRPVKTVNPVLANWRKSWDATAARFPLAAIKLFPNYHNYTLDDARVETVCQKAGNLPVLISLRVNDERNQPSFLQVAGTPAGDVAALSRRHPQVRFVALCAYGSELPALAKGGRNLFADISFLDGMGMLEQAAKVIPPERLVLGSHEAFAHAQAARLKLAHSSLPPDVLRGIASENLTSPLSLSHSL